MAQIIVGNGVTQTNSTWKFFTIERITSWFLVQSDGG